MPLEKHLPPNPNAAQRLSDALRYIDRTDVRFNIAGTSVIIAGLVMNSYSPLIAMCDDTKAPGFVVLSWIATIAAGVLCYQLFRNYQSQDDLLAQHMRKNLLDEGLYVRTFDQAFATPPPKNMWARALRSRRSLQLSSDSLVQRIVALVEHYHFLCRKMRLSPRPEGLQWQWAWTRFWLVAVLLSGPVLLLLGLLTGYASDDYYSSGGIFGALNELLDQVASRLSFLPFWLQGFPKVLTLAGLSYIVLLWPAMRLLHIIERATLRRELHDIVEGEFQGEVDFKKLRKVEADLEELRERVEASSEQLDRRSLRV